MKKYKFKIALVFHDLESMVKGICNLGAKKFPVNEYKRHGNGKNIDISFSYETNEPSTMIELLNNEYFSGLIGLVEVKYNVEYTLTEKIEQTIKFNER